MELTEECCGFKIEAWSGKFPGPDCLGGLVGVQIVVLGGGTVGLSLCAGEQDPVEVNLSEECFHDLIITV